VTTKAFIPGDLSWAQLEPGRFRVNQRIVDVGGVTFARHSFNLGMKAESATGPSNRSVGVIADARTSARWFGSPLTYNDVAVSRGTLNLVTAGPSAFYSMTVDADELLHEFPNNSSIRTLVENAGQAQLDHDAQYARQLRSFICSILESFEGDQSVSRMQLDASLNRSLQMVAPAFEKSARRDRPQSETRRIAAVRACEEYVRENIDASPSLFDLSRISGLRLRSLINAFQAVTGMSPMAYLKLQRLNGVHRALLAADKTQTRIVDIAANWGFWHMGHFASDYRLMFHETPSETLALS
jgi:AraC family transcriptional regulator, ethanolamine operon transcriptional activator